MTTPTLFDRYKAGYTANWDRLAIRPPRAAEAKWDAEKLLDGKPRYLACADLCGTIPWWFFGLTHYRESTFNFDTYLGNGQSLHRRTTIVPAGRGPFYEPHAFEKGAYDAMKIMGFVGATDWSIARASFRLEGFNGFGYHRYGVNSPYLYGGSTLYGPPEARGGKFVADHDFDGHYVDTQLGVLVLLKALMALDTSIVIPGAAPAVAVPEPDDHLHHGILWVQQTLNAVERPTPLLAEDGRLGKKTMNAVRAFQADHGLPVTGLPDDATVAALEQAATRSPSALGPRQSLAREIVDLMQHLFHFKEHA